MVPPNMKDAPEFWWPEESKDGSPISITAEEFGKMNAVMVFLLTYITTQLELCGYKDKQG